MTDIEERLEKLEAEVDSMRLTIQDLLIDFEQRRADRAILEGFGIRKN